MAPIKRDDTLKELIRIGATEDFACLDTMFEKHSAGDKCYLLDLEWEIPNHFRILKTNEIAALTKVLVKAENLGFFGVMSTSKIRKMFKELRRRRFKTFHDLEEWAYQLPCHK